MQPVTKRRDPIAELRAVHQDCEKLSTGVYGRLPEAEKEKLRHLAEGFKIKDSHISRFQSAIVDIYNYFIAIKHSFRISVDTPPWYFTYENRTFRRELHAIAYRGDCLFLGYRSPFDRDPIPEVIPPEQWWGEIDWEDNSISWFGVRYEDVRFVEGEMAAAVRALGHRLVISQPDAD